jgi:membrane protease YdiL (CAAX protease family)
MLDTPPSSSINKRLSATFSLWLLAGISAIASLLPSIHVPAAALLIALLLLHDTTKANYLRTIAWVGVFVVGVFMALYRPDGFSYFNSISADQLHEQGKPYQQFVNLGKFFGAAIIFTWIMLGSVREDIALSLTRRNLLIAAGSAFSILWAAIILLGLNFTPKFSQLTLVFLLVNLVVTCFSEETFYRLVVQRPSEKMFSKPIVSHIFGIVVASAFFTLTHLSDQLYVSAVMMIAGIFYAVTYSLTRSLGSAIIAHFSVNAVHFILLPYPI